jgi:hypothetical protein
LARVAGPGAGSPLLNLLGVLDPPITPYAPPFPLDSGLSRPEPGEEPNTGNRSPAGCDEALDCLNWYAAKVAARAGEGRLGCPVAGIGRGSGRSIVY